MADVFQFDAFLSHSAKDKTVVREMAERLRTDGLLYLSSEFRVSEIGFPPLAVCLSANSFSADCAQLEANTFDLLCHLAFDALVLTRCQRADRVNRQKTAFNKFFAKEAGEIMNNLQE